MAPSRYIYFITIGIHASIIVAALGKLVLQERLRSQVFERQIGMVTGGSTATTTILWTLGLRLFQLVVVQALLLHMAAILVSSRLFSDSYTRHLSEVSHLWSVLTIICLLENMVAFALFMRFINTTQSSLQESLYGGLEMIQFDTSWSDFWNDLQTHSGCCGVHKYTDWSGMMWENAETEAQYRRLVSDSTVLVPISCCRKGMLNHPSYTSERVNLGVTELLRSADPHISDIINHGGCFDAIWSSLSNTVAMIRILDVILCSMQLCTLFAMRILFIANRNFQSHSTLR